MEQIITAKTLEKIPTSAQQNIDLEIQKIITNLNRHGQYSELTLECMAALTAGQARWKELKEQRTLKRVFRAFTGKNRVIQQAMQQDVFHFQYVALKILQVLAERQFFTMDMLAVIQNKLNYLQLENDAKFKELQTFTQDLLTNMQRNFQHVNKRLDALETNSNVLTWNITIHSKNYEKLSMVEKIIYVSREYFDLTSGEWTHNDELLLEDVMERLSMNNFITLKQLFNELFTKQDLLEKLFGKVPFFEIEENSLYHKEAPIFIAYGCYQRRDFSVSYFTQKMNLDTSLNVRYIVYEIVSSLATMKELSQTQKISPTFDVVLQQILNPDLRLNINACIHRETKLTIENCRAITKSLPAIVNSYSTYDEALQLKKALEGYKCKIDIY